jgi:hypothetical protein
MRVRKVTAAVSALLLIALTVAVAEAALFALLTVFSSILRVYLVVELADRYLLVNQAPWVPTPHVSVHQAGAVGSAFVTLGCGLGAAAWRYRRWRPA